MSARCERCGGLVTPDARWCGQCYAPIGSPAPEAELASGPDPEEGSGERPGSGWRCPSCGRQNRLEADICADCGTSFDRLLKEPDPLPAVEPAHARRLSFLFPGLGHLAARQTTHGLARIVTFAWLLGATLAVILARRGQGLGRATILVVLYGLAATVLYTVTPVDAERAASGEAPVLSSRVIGIGLGVLLLLTFALPFLLR